MVNRPDLRFPGFRSTAAGPDRNPVVDLRFPLSQPGAPEASAPEHSALEPSALEPRIDLSRNEALAVLKLGADADWDTVRTVHQARLASAADDRERHWVNTAYASLRLLWVD